MVTCLPQSQHSFGAMVVGNAEFVGLSPSKNHTTREEGILNTLFEMYDIEVPKGATLEERALAFHLANPKVYQELRRLSLTLYYRGHKHFGVKMCLEQMRWNWYEHTTDTSTFRLNNSYSAFYARLLMETEPELRGVFSTRTTRGELVLNMEGLDD